MSEEKKKCPFCMGEIPAEATQCPVCGKVIPPSNESVELYNPNAAANWSILLSPVFGSYVLMKNWRTLGNENAAKRSKIWMIALAALIVILSFLDVPAYGSALLLLLVWLFCEQKPQIRYIKAHCPAYQKKKWGKTAGSGIGIYCVSLLVLTLTVACFSSPTLDIEDLNDSASIQQGMGEFMEDLKGEGELGKQAAAAVLILTGQTSRYGDPAQVRKGLQKINGKSARQIIRIAQKEHPETWANVINEMKQAEAISNLTK